MTQAPPEPVTLRAKLATHRETIREIFVFCLVGGTAYIVNSATFWCLQYEGPRLLENEPMLAKVIAVALATAVAWMGNRMLTFRHKKSDLNTFAEFQAFALVNVIGLLIELACLGFTHYFLAIWFDWADDPITDMISANGVGFVLGTIFRFLAYKYWLFNGDKTPAEDHERID